MNKTFHSRFLFIDKETNLIFNQSESQDDDMCGIILSIAAPVKYSPNVLIEKNSLLINDDKLFLAKQAIKKSDNISWNNIRNKMVLVSENKNNYALVPYFTIDNQSFYLDDLIHDGDKLNSKDKTIMPNYWINHGYDDIKVHIEKYKIDIITLIANSLMKGLDVKTISNKIPSFFILNKNVQESVDIVDKNPTNPINTLKPLIIIENDTYTISEDVLPILKELVKEQLIVDGDKLFKAYNNSTETTINVSDITFSI